GLLANNALHASLDGCRELRTLRGHREEVEAAHFSPDGRQVLSWARHRSARLWDAATGKEELVLRGKAGKERAATNAGGVPVVDFTMSLPVAARWTAAGPRVLAAGEALYVLDAATGEVLARFQNPDPSPPLPKGVPPDLPDPLGADLSPDGGRVVA